MVAPVYFSAEDYPKFKKNIFNLIEEILLHPNNIERVFRKELSIFDKAALLTWGAQLRYNHGDLFDERCQIEIKDFINIASGAPIHPPRDRSNFIIQCLKDPDTILFLKKNEPSLKKLIATVMPRWFSFNFNRLKERTVKKHSLKPSYKKLVTDLFQALDKSEFNEAYLKKNVVPLFTQFLNEAIEQYAQLSPPLISLLEQGESRRLKVDPLLSRTLFYPLVVQTNIGKVPYDNIIQHIEIMRQKVPALNSYLEHYPLVPAPKPELPIEPVPIIKPIPDSMTVPEPVIAPESVAVPEPILRPPEEVNLPKASPDLNIPTDCTSLSISTSAQEKPQEKPQKKSFLRGILDRILSFGSWLVNRIKSFFRKKPLSRSEVPLTSVRAPESIAATHEPRQNKSRRIFINPDENDRLLVEILEIHQESRAKFSV